MTNDGEGSMKILELTQGEINALKKAILYLKFSCEETESLLYAGSHLINKAFDKIISVDDFGDQAKVFYSNRNIENEKFINLKLDKLESEKGYKLNDDVKKTSFQKCLYPFPSDV